MRQMNGRTAAVTGEEAGMDALPAQFRGDAVIDEICLHRAGKKPFA